MLSEIEAAMTGGCETYHDAVTVSDIAYCKDIWIWIAYQGQESTEAVINYGSSWVLRAIPLGILRWIPSLPSMDIKEYRLMTWEGNDPSSIQTLVGQVFKVMLMLELPIALLL